MRLAPRLAPVFALAVLASFAALGQVLVRSRGGAGQIEVAPLPEPPALELASEPVPGDDGAMAVVVARPQGAVRGEARPAVTFSKPVVALGAAEGLAPPPITISPPIPGEWRWLGSASVELEPAGPVPASTRFTVTVAKGLQALDGAALAEPFSFTFETPRPAVRSVEPRSRWAASREVVKLVLNQPVADLEQKVKLLVAGQPWPYGVKAVRLADEQRAREASRAGRVRREAPARQDDGVRYELTPARPLPLDAEVVVVVEAGLAGAAGPLTLEKEVRHAFRTYGPLRLEGLKPCPWESLGCHYGPLTFATTNPVDPATLKGRIKVTPPVAIDWDEVDVSNERFTLPGRFRPGVTYQVSVEAGVKDAFGQPLAGPYQASAAMADLRPDLDTGDSVALVEASSDGAVPASAVNVGKVRVRTRPLSPGDLARLLSDRRGEAAPGFGGVPERFIDVRAPRNVTRVFPIPVRQHLAGSGTTLFAAEVSAPEVPARAADGDSPGQVGLRRVILGQVTDLAVHAKLGGASGIAWVTRLSDGQPVGGARVAIHDATGAERWSGTTGPDGLARLPGLAEVIQDQNEVWWGVPFALVAARLGADTGVTTSTWQGGFAPWAFSIPFGWAGRNAALLGGVWAERGLYRPGDTVHLKGLLRQRLLGELRAPQPGATAEVTVTGARGKALLVKTVPLTAFGTFALDLPLPPDAPLGVAKVEARLRPGVDPQALEATFRVEEYRAPQFKVDVSMPKAALVEGQEVKAAVLARYLFGAAMARSPVRWSLVRETADFAPPRHDGWTFGLRSWLWDDGEPGRSADVGGQGEGVTDALGAFEVKAGRAEALAGRTWTYSLEAEVEDASRQRLAGRAAVVVHPAALYAGLRQVGAGFAEAGKPATVEVVAADWEGERQAGATLQVQVRRRDWKWVKKKVAGGEWASVNEVVETPVAACALRSGPAPVRCAFTPAEPGLYVAEVTVTDGQGRRQASRLPVYATGAGWVSWQRGDSDRVELVADKPVYRPGETARLLVKSPWPEAEALLTVEREGVRSARRVHLAGAATTLDVPVGEADVPNVFASVVLARGRTAEPEPGGEAADPGRPQVRVGYLQLRVEKAVKRLAVRLTPDAAEKRPRDQVKVAVEVRDARGQGVPAEVTVWAVDEGVLRLTGYQPPDPVELLHPEQPLSVRLAEPLVHLVERRRYGEKGFTSGGGGGGDAAGAGFRSEFKTTVLFAPEVITGADGRASVTIELPDNLTTYRIMAVAATRGDQSGAGAAEVRVTKPLLALPALPRLARVGDAFEAGVVVHAPGGQVKSVEVRAEAVGLRLEGPATQQVSLSGGRREVRFRFRAEAPGQAVLRFSVAGGGLRDGLEQRLPVVLPVSLEAVAVGGDTRGERREGLAPPGGVRPDVGGLTVTLASTALGGFAEDMRALVEYPYGCLEQLSSRLTPFIALRELQGRFGLRHAPGAPPGWLDEASSARLGTRDPDEIVRRTVKAIEALQLEDGGYRYWPSSRGADEYASSLAVLALGRAAEVGYPVDRAALARGQRYLADTVAAGRCTRGPFGCAPPADAVRVAALHALARTGSPRASAYGELFGRRDRLPLFARAQLADAMFVGGGDRAQARRLLQELLSLARESADGLHLEEPDPRASAALLGSDVRSTALLLQALVDVSPDHPSVAKLAAWLGKARRGSGRFGTTQESSQALQALAEVVRVKEREVPAFTGRVALGGAELAAAPFQGRSTEVRTVQVPLARLAAAGAGQAAPLPLDFRRDGEAGVLYYGALLRSAPREAPVTPLERGLFVQRWLEPWQGGGQVRAARAGDLLRVRVRLATPQERRFVALEVPLPAGLEIVDTTLATTAAPRRPPAEEEPWEPTDEELEADDTSGAEPAAEPAAAPPPSPWASAFWSPFVHQERRDDRLLLFADRLPPGTHLVSFVVRATTPGEWTLPPARAEEMYAPDVFGRSDGGAFKVVVGGEVAAR